MSDHTTHEIPYGYCHCGCGQKTRIATETSHQRGWIKGEPRKFLRGHYSRLMWKPWCDRFWESVDKGQSSTCWNWIATKRADGYGNFQIGKRKLRAHRVSWELHHGPIAKGLHVLHRCDNPSCVNPNHLFLGDDAENMQDKMRKGRAARPYGNKPSHRFLTDEQARQLRQDFANSDMSINEYAKLHNVGRSTMRNIIRGLTYRDI